MIPFRSTLWLTAVIQELGADVEELRQRYPMEIASLLDENAQTIPDATNRLLLDIEQSTQNPHVGLDAATFSQFREMGFYGYLLLNAHTLGELLKISERYYAILHRTAAIRLVKGSGTIRFEYQRLIVSQLSSRHSDEWALGFFVNIIRKKLGNSWRPLEVTFTNPPPETLNKLHDFFGNNIIFSQPTNSFTINNDLLDTEIGNADPKLLPVIKSNADELLRSYAVNESFDARVRMLITENLGVRAVNIAYFSKQMGMSVSTFKRRLYDCKRTFKGVRDNIVLSLAKKALAETDSSITNIALMLGYSELSAFDRSFSRLTGTSPRKYRQAAHQSRQAHATNCRDISSHHNVS